MKGIFCFVFEFLELEFLVELIIILGNGWSYIVQREDKGGSEVLSVLVKGWNRWLFGWVLDSFRAFCFKGVTDGQVF